MLRPHENDENGRCHAGKGIVYQRHDFWSVRCPFCLDFQGNEIFKKVQKAAGRERGRPESIQTSYSSSADFKSELSYDSPVEEA